MNVTEQVPDDKMQLSELKDPVGPVSLKATLPDGTVAVPGEGSDIVAVQVDAWLTTTGLKQDNAVELERRFTVMIVGPLALPL